VARKQSVKYLMKSALSNKLALGRSKYEDQKQTRIERHKLMQKGVPYQERLKINKSQDYIYCTNTFNIYNRHVEKFATYLEQEHGIKKVNDIEEAIPYIQQYINYLDKEKDWSPYTIYLATSAIAKATNTYVFDYEKPRRTSANITRGRQEAINDEKNERLAKKSMEINRLLGLRRSQLSRLKVCDIRERYIGKQRICEVHTIGKGKKHNIQIFYKKDEIEKVLALKNGKADNEYILTKEEMNHDADLHSMRRERACYLYNAILEEIENDSDKRKFYQDEIRRIFREAGKTVTENMDKKVYLRGATRQKAINEGLEIEYDRTALLAVSCMVLNHYRSNVTLAYYIR